MIETKAKAQTSTSAPFFMVAAFNRYLTKRQNPLLNPQPHGMAGERH